MSLALLGSMGIPLPALSLNYFFHWRRNLSWWNRIASIFCQFRLLLTLAYCTSGFCKALASMWYTRQIFYVSVCNVHWKFGQHEFSSWWSLWTLWHWKLWICYHTLRRSGIAFSLCESIRLHSFILFLKMHSLYMCLVMVWFRFMPFPCVQCSHRRLHLSQLL